MSWFQVLFRGKAREQDLDSELRFHLEQQMRENVAVGMDPPVRATTRAAAVELTGIPNEIDLGRRRRSRNPPISHRGVKHV
jgi:hypothetical protein